MNLKFHLFKKYTNILRGFVSYIPRISSSDKSFNFTELNGKVELDLDLGSRKDIILTTGVSFSKFHYRNNWNLNQNKNFKLLFYTSIRFHGKIYPSISGLKKLLNKIF